MSTSCKPRMASGSPGLPGLRWTFILLGMLLVACFISPTLAQQSEDDMPTGLIPDRACVAIVGYPQQLAKFRSLSWFPREIVAAQSLQDFGFDAMAIEQSLTFLTLPGDFQREPPEFVSVLQFSKMQGLSDAITSSRKATRIGGREAFLGDLRRGEPGYLNPSYVIYDEATILVGTPRLLEQSMSGKGGTLKRLIEASEISGELRVYVDVSKFRELVQALSSRLRQIPPPLAPWFGMPDQLETIEIGYSHGDGFRTRVVMTANDEASAHQVAETMEKSLLFVHAMLLERLAEELDQNDPVQAATINYVNRIWDKYESNLVPRVEGNRLSMELHEEVLALPLLAGFLARSVDQMLVFKVTPEQKVREVALAALNYESAYRSLPPATIDDADGRPLFSGLVAILPFMEQSALANELRMDEPWDSPHNREVLSRYPSPFGGEDMGPIRIPQFPGSLWDGEQKQFAQILDGTSNTILAIEAPASLKTSWADPAPWKISPTNPKRDIFGDRDSVVVVLLDGSVRRLEKDSVSNEQLKAMLTVAAGDLVD